MPTPLPARRLFAPLALAALLAAPPAAAIYIAPDLVHIPADRLIANLDRSVVADGDAAARAARHITLGRLHAAAWAQKSDKLPATSPLSVVLGMPEVVAGPGDARVLRGAFAYLGGRRGSIARTFATPGPEDAAYGCDAGAVAARHDHEGRVVVEVFIPAEPRGADAKPRPPRVRVVSSTVDAPAVAPCVAARVASLSFPAAGADVTVRQPFDFVQAPDRVAPFYGFGDSHVPEQVAPPPADAEAVAAARRHLEASRRHYEQALEADPESALATLGLGWVLEQLGHRDEAIARYREAFKLGWAKEQRLVGLGLGQQPIAVEAARHLVPLLDPEADADEIARMRAAGAKLDGLVRPVTPILVPLTDETRLEALVDAAAAVRFDLDGSGADRAWGWIRPEAAWLVWDGAGGGEVTSGLQLFGGVSFWTFWEHGYAALAALDDDGDGELRGAELDGLALWRDADGDGVSDPGEVRPVRAWGVTALATRAEVHASGVPFSPRGVTFADGRTRPTWDWVTEGRQAAQ